MGIIKAVFAAGGGALADQWLEVIQADDMGDKTVFTTGVKVRRDDRRNQNKKSTADYITDGSIVYVSPNQFMILVDGGKVVDYTAEEGYYKVENDRAPSLFNGQFGQALRESFDRIKFGGVTPRSQQVFYINLQEIRGIKFGTKSPLNYFDNFYNSELFLRAFGEYSIKISDPLKFFREVVPRNAIKVDIDDINSQFLSEFLTALSSTMNKMSADGIRISYVPSKSQELSDYMADCLDEKWQELRGMEVISVSVSSISYDDESKDLINQRNKGAMLSDPNIREAYVQGAIARGIEQAGSNDAGSAQAFMGVGMGLSSAGGFMESVSKSNQRQIKQNISQNATNSWNCSCGSQNTGNFCTNCGSQKPQDAAENAFCSNCGAKLDKNSKFCSNCGQKIG